MSYQMRPYEPQHIFHCSCGLNFIKTRKRQKECVPCMKIHESLGKHEQLKIVTDNKTRMSDMSL